MNRLAVGLLVSFILATACTTVLVWEICVAMSAFTSPPSHEILIIAKALREIAECYEE